MCSVENGVFRYFAKFTARHLCQSLFFNNVAGRSSTTLLKKSLWHSLWKSLWNVSDSRFHDSKWGEKINSTERCLKFLSPPYAQIYYFATSLRYHSHIISYFWFLILSYGIYRRPFKIGVLKNFAIFKGKHLCWSLFLINLWIFKACKFTRNRLQCRCFPVNIAKFLRTVFLQKTCRGYYYKSFNSFMTEAVII